MSSASKLRGYQYGTAAPKVGILPPSCWQSIRQNKKANYANMSVAIFVFCSCGCNEVLETSISPRVRLQFRPASSDNRL
jgi:hypothetical protein